MIELRQTETFRKWRSRLKDEGLRARIASRLDRLAFGNAGDVKPIGGGVRELRIDHGPGYRIYMTRQRSTVILLLCGGDQSTQQKDIRLAKRFLEERNEENAG